VARSSSKGHRRRATTAERTITAETQRGAETRVDEEEGGVEPQSAQRTQRRGERDEKKDE